MTNEGRARLLYVRPSSENEPSQPAKLLKSGDFGRARALVFPASAKTILEGNRWE